MRASRYPYDHPHLIFPVSVRAPLRRETTRTAGHPGGAAVGEPGECKQAWAVVPGQQAGATQAQAVANLGVATEADVPAHVPSPQWVVRAVRGVDAGGADPERARAARCDFPVEISGDMILCIPWVADVQAAKKVRLEPGSHAGSAGWPAPPPR